MVFKLDIPVGLGEIAISKNPDDLIKTFALASCVGITAYSKNNHVAGMIHIVLPERPTNSDLQTPPGYYAKTGVPAFINKLLSAGCRKSDLKISIYGGAESRFKDHFNIGRRNLDSVKEALLNLGLDFILADVGGKISRTLIMDVSTGNVSINTLPIMI